MTAKLAWKWRALQHTELARRLRLPSKYSSVFTTTLSRLRESERWSAGQHAAYQLEKTRGLLQHCAAHVPYYRALFHQVGFRPEALPDLRGLSALPFLDRATISRRAGELIAGNYPQSRLQYFTTAGSTGIPLGFYLDADYTDAARAAFFARMWGWTGYRAYERGVVLRGSVVEGCRDGVICRHSRLNNKLYISSYHLRPGALTAVYELIADYQPRSIQAYPSAITMLAQHVLERRLPPILSVRVLLCGSENLYGWQRDLLRKAFACRVFTWYGHSENVLLAGECEHSTEYHCFSEHGVFELVRPDGSIIDQPDEVGEIVGTGFLNDAMPLVRYRTGDTACWAEGPCVCGRAYRRFARIDGRLQELIVTADGRRISMAAINMHSDVFDEVRQFQFVQDVPGKVLMQIIRKPSYTALSTERIVRELRKKMGDDMVVDLAFVDDIPLTARGKHRFLRQNLRLRCCD